MRHKLEKLSSTLNDRGPEFERLANRLSLFGPESTSESSKELALELGDISDTLEDPLPSLAERLRGVTARFDTESINTEDRQFACRLLMALSGGGEEHIGLFCSIYDANGRAKVGNFSDHHEGVDSEDARDYCDESREHMRTAETHLLEMEQTGGTDGIDEIFRAVHSVKGGAQYLGLAATTRVSHEMETVLDALRAGRMEPTPSAIAILLQAVDALNELLAALESRKPATTALEPLLTQLMELATTPATHLESASQNAFSGDAGLFTTECRQHLAEAKSIVAKYGKQPLTTDESAALRRALHSVKGIAGLVGLSRMELLATALEGATAEFAPGSPMVPDQARTAIESSLAALDAILERFSSGEPDSEDVSSYIRALDQVRGFDGADALESTMSTPESSGVAPMQPSPVSVVLTTEILADEGDRELVGIYMDSASEQLASVIGSVDADDPESAFATLSDLEHASRYMGYDGVESAFKTCADAVKAGEKEQALSLLRVTQQELANAALKLQGETADTLERGTIPAVGTPPGTTEETRTDDVNDGEAEIFEAEFRERFESATIHLEALSSTSHSTCDWSGLGRDFHSIKGLAGYVGIPEMEELASALERWAHEASTSSRDSLSAMQAELASAMEMLQEIRRQSRSSEPTRVDVSEQISRLSGLGDAPSEQPAREPDHAPPRDDIEYDAASGSSPGTIEDLDAEKLDDLHDIELIDIYAETSRQQILLAIEHVDNGELTKSTEVLEDLRRAAAYMGYPALRARFEAAKRVAERGDSDVRQALAAILDELGPVRPVLSPEVPDGRRSGEPVVSPPATQSTFHRSGDGEENDDPRPALSDGTVLSAAHDEDRTRKGRDRDTGRARFETQSTVRVDTDKIDSLINMVAELVVNRSGFMVLLQALRQQHTTLVESGTLSKAQARGLRNLVNRYEEVTGAMGRVGNQLQEGVMRMRMLPLKTLFARVPRLVRDLAVREKREVNVVFNGEDTELDKTVIEVLVDPLLHILRNAIGHGVESPEERLRVGKPAQATIRVSAQHQGNMVTIDIEDDGRGIDLGAIRSRLRKLGRMSLAAVDQLDERELLNAVFRPGFSTARELSEISGRGVGLDVAKKNIEMVGGSIDLVSEPGRFCRFTIRIPLTMAIMQALLVEVRDETFSIPTAAVVQVTKLVMSEIATVEGREVMTLRDRVIPLVRLSNALRYQYHEAVDILPAQDPWLPNVPLHVVVVHADGRELGLVVDKLIGGQDIVIKSLDDEVLDSQGMAGAAILGDGSITLIVDVAALQRKILDETATSQWDSTPRFPSEAPDPAAGGLDTPPSRMH